MPSQTGVITQFLTTRLVRKSPKFAKLLRRGLLADGKDATQYGLSQSATSSPAEWAKRGTNLIDNGLEHLAVQCFLQARHLILQGSLS